MKLIKKTLPPHLRNFNSCQPGQTFWRRTLPAFVVMAASVISLSGCGMALTLKAKVFHEESGGSEVTALRDDRMARAVADEFGLMALFSHVVYRRDLNSGSKTKTEAGRVKECDYLKDPSTTDPYGMPVSADGLSGWERWIPKGMSEKELKPCFNGEGLFYETYVYRNQAGTIEEAVVAFRGTENTRSQFRADWKANLYALFGLEPTQYRLAREYVPEVIKALRKVNPDMRIYSAGHSLGGGLAQQAGYRNREIAKVFTFNTSPVTNWTALRLKGLVQNEYPTIYRLYHSGEVLEKIRFVTTNFTTTRYRRYDLGMQFRKRSNLGGHAMEILACTFAALVSEPDWGGQQAKHFYPRKYAKALVDSKADGLCESGYRKLVRETEV